MDVQDPALEVEDCGKKRKREVVGSCATRSVCVCSAVNSTSLSAQQNRCRWETIHNNEPWAQWLRPRRYRCRVILTPWGRHSLRSFWNPDCLFFLSTEILKENVAPTGGLNPDGSLLWSSCFQSGATSRRAGATVSC